jgi:signal transduction histidine kinase/ActR/RegA family two-component response regulator
MLSLKNYLFILIVSSIALSVPLWNLHTNYIKDQTFITNELKGVSLLKTISPLIKLIPEHRDYFMSNRFSGIFTYELKTTRQQLHSSLEIFSKHIKRVNLSFNKEDFQIIFDQISILIQNPIHYTHNIALWDEAQLVFHEHNKVMENLILLIRQIADQSNLILDPWLDSYYLMDLTVNRFPELINVLGKVRGYQTGLTIKQEIIQLDLHYLENIYGYMRFLLVSLDRSMTQVKKSSNHNMISLQERLNTFQQKYDHFEVIKRIKMSPPRQKINISANHWFVEMSMLINLMYDESTLVLKTLDKILRERLDVREQDHYVAFVSTILILFILVSIVYLLFVNIYKRQSIARFRAESAAEIALRDLSEKNAKQQQLFAIIGHELRTPASVIKMLLEHSEAQFESLPHKDILYNTVDHLMDILDDMRTVINPEWLSQGEVIATSLLEVIQRSVMYHERLIQDSSLVVSLTLDDVPEELLMLNARLLRQIIINMIKNCALHANARHLHIVLKLIDSKQQIYNLSFDDDGIGIKSEYVLKLFNAFSRGDDTQADGTGLGLYLSRKFAQEQLNGNLYYEPSHLGGARFILTMCLTPAPKAIIKEEDETPMVSLKAMHILFVEDNPLIAKLSLVQLKNAGAKVIHAENGQVALQQIENNLFDLILTDLFMPEMNGDELTRHIRILKFDGPIIGITAASVGDEIDVLKQAGADFVLLKPLNINRLQYMMSKYKMNKKIR